MFRPRGAFIAQSVSTSHREKYGPAAGLRENNRSIVSPPGGTIRSSAHMMSMDTSLPNLASPSATEAERIFAAMSRCRNLFSDPIKVEPRARLYNFLESPTKENWLDTRSLLVGGHQTLWQAVTAVGIGDDEVPTSDAVLVALENVAVAA